jgi:acyl carrier protein
MNQEEIRTRTRAILAKTLGIDPSQISADASPLNLAAWDSLRHMNVVLSMENEFNIEFEDSEIQKLNSLELLAEAIARHLAE